MDSSQHKGADVASSIWIIGSPIIFTVGVFGNIMTISVLSRPRYGKSSTSVFLMFLSVADLLVITTILPRWWFIYLFGIDIRHVNNVLCKWHWFFAYFINCVSNAILVAVTTERIISIIKPYKVRTVCTVKTATVTSIAIIFTMIAFHSHTLYGLKLFNVTHYNFENVSYTNSTIRLREDNWNSTNGSSSTSEKNTFEVDTATSPDFDTMHQFEFKHNISASHLLDLCNSTVSNVDFNISNEYIQDGNAVLLKSNNCELVLRYEVPSSMCWFDDSTYGEFFLGTYHLMVIFIYNVIPEVWSLIGIAVIVRRLAASRKLRRKMQVPVARDTCFRSKRSNFDSHSAQITRSLILVNAAFITLTTPVQIFLLGRSAWIDQDAGMTETQEIIWAIFNMLHFINHAINFILYFLSGARFRKHVKETLRCICKRHTQSGLSQSQDGKMFSLRPDSDYKQQSSSVSQFQ